MLTIHLGGVSSRSQRVIGLPQDCTLTLESLILLAQNHLSVPKEHIYFTHNGKRVLDNDNPICDGVVRILPRLPGGKGGFGSMLRAIGAQIEKTTNREACRDLSGRRLRDINEEKRLKSWISKKADREREAEERRKKKLEKLRSEPKVEFSDKKYEAERNKLTEVVHDAVEKGFEAAASNPGSSNCSASKRPTVRRGFMLEEEEISDDSSDSSSSSEEESQDISHVSKHEADPDSDEEHSTHVSKPKADSDSDEEHSIHVSKRKADSDSDEPSPAKRKHLQESESVSESSSHSSGESSDDKN